jgi:2-keto-4-pentenoate hydratase
MDPLAAARLLADARANNTPVPWQSVLPGDEEQARKIQDATLDIIGPVGGWKVGAKSMDATPACSPLPASRVLASGCTLDGAEWKLRGLEVELAFRLGRDLDAADESLTSDRLFAAVDAMVPVIEVVETRLDGWGESDPLATMADLQSSGALIVGVPTAPQRSHADLRALHAALTVDGIVVAQATGGNPAGDAWRLLAWLAQHAAVRGRPLRAGQVVTTGSCCGVFFAAPGARVQGDVAGIGRVEVYF